MNLVTLSACIVLLFFSPTALIAQCVIPPCVFPDTLCRFAPDSSVQISGCELDSILIIQGDTIETGFTIIGDTQIIIPMALLLPYWEDTLWEVLICDSIQCDTLLISIKGDSSRIEYDTSAFCPNGFSSLPEIWPTGGTFLGSVGLSLNDSGCIDLDSSEVGLHSVQYIGPGCSLADSFQLTIHPIDSSYFEIPPLGCAGKEIRPDSIVGIGNFFGYSIFPPFDTIHFTDSVNGAFYGVEGVYLIHHLTNGYCPSLSSNFTWIAPESKAGFTYPGDFFCGNHPAILPILDSGSVAGGVFSGSPLDSLGLPLSIASNVGLIDLAASADTLDTLTYEVKYMTEFSLCPDTAYDTIAIYPTALAWFKYPRLGFCMSDSNPVPESIIPGGAYTFEPGDGDSPDSGLVFVDSTTGEINLSMSLPGQYWVRHEVGTSGISTECSDVHETLVILIDQPEVHIAYDSLWDTVQYCRNLGFNPSPLITLIAGDSNTLTASFFSTPPGLDLSFVTGIIEPEDSEPGIYQVAYVAAQGACKDTSVATIEVLPIDDAGFTYPESEYCLGAAPYWIEPSFNWFGGSFQVAEGLVFFDSDLGIIDLLASDPGTYSVQYKMDSICPDSQSQTVHLYPSPLIHLYSDKGNRICEGESVVFSAEPGITPAQFWLGSDSLTFEGGPNSITLSPMNGDLVWVETTTVNGCSDADTLMMHVSPLPEGIIRFGLDYSVSPTNVLPSNTPFNIWFTAVNTDSTYFRIEIEPNEAFSTTFYHDSTAMVLKGDSTYRPQLIFMDDTQGFPAEIVYRITPISKGCVGALQEYAFTVFPHTDDFFIPSIVTPNNDGLNDTWKIGLRPGLNPSNFNLLLFNRSGGMIRQWDSLDFEWSADVMEGTYWYLVRERDMIVKKGGLLIQRR